MIRKREDDVRVTSVDCHNRFEDIDQNLHFEIFPTFVQYHYLLEYIEHESNLCIGCSSCQEENIIYHRAFLLLVRSNPIDSDYLDYPIHHPARDQESYPKPADNVELVH